MKKVSIFFIPVFIALIFLFVSFSASFAFEVPNIVFNFQQPSYVTDKNPLLSEFTCDITKPECKVNFDLSSSFTGSFSSSDFLCSLDFGMGTPTGEESKCNPNTVIFTGSYDYVVRFQIVSKSDSAIFSERTLTIHSGYTPSDSETSTGTLSDSGTLADSGSSIPEETLVSTGIVSPITHNSAVLSGVVLEPETLIGIVYYGTGELSLSGAISLGAFSFAWLFSDTEYLYRIGFSSSSWSGEILSETGSFRTLPIEPAPDVVFNFQQASYVTEKNPELSEFNCDSTKPDCRINFDLSPSFTGSFTASDFYCLLDFGMELTTGEEAKCNPSTVIFSGSTDYRVRFRIVSKTDSRIFSERILTIHSWIAPVETSSGTLDNSGTLNDSEGVSDSGSLDSSWTLLVPENSLNITEPEIIIQSGIDSSFRCTKTDCIVNLEYVPRDSREACVWSFSWGTYSEGTQDNCNPGYIHYPIGDFTVTLRVYEEGNTANFREKSFDFSNIAPVVSSGGGSTTTPISSSSATISISDPVIIVQSGLDAESHCKKSDCAVNLEYKVLGSKEACLWDFPWGTYTEGTQNKCNPGYVRYPFGEFTILLRVYEQGNDSNYHEKTLRIFNGTPAEIYEAEMNPQNHPPEAIIALQGTVGKTKIHEGNSVKCIGVDECNINLTGEQSYDLDRDKLTYLWDFGNGETGTKANPSAMKYGTGEYTVLLRVIDTEWLFGETRFLISVLGKYSEKVPEEIPIDPFVSELQIVRANPNPPGIDGILEWVEIYNPLANNISLAGCTLDDDEGKGSEPYFFPSDSKIPANTSRRWYKIQTELSLNNSNDSANLRCGEKLISMLVWDYSVPEWSIVSLEKIKTERIMGFDETLDDFLEVAQIVELGSEKLDAELLNRVLFLEKETKKANKREYSLWASGMEQNDTIKNIHISLQWVLSKNRTLAWNTFTCFAKLTCSVNLTAGKTRKDTVYFWDFGNGEVFYGANPLARTFPIGRFTVMLRVLDTKTMNVREEYFHITVKKIVTVKKPKAPKTPIVKTEKPLVIQGNDYFAPPDLSSKKISPIQASVSAGIIALLFFGGVHMIVRRKPSL